MEFARTIYYPNFLDKISFWSTIAEKMGYIICEVRFLPLLSVFYRAVGMGMYITNYNSS
jgi:hypothetical protein